MFIPACAGAWIATDNARWLRDVLQLACARLNLNRKEIESYTGLTEKQQSDQFTLKQPMNIWRLANLPRAFWLAVAQVLLEQAGYVVFDRRLISLIVAVQQTPRPMLKVVELPAQDREQAG